VKVADLAPAWTVTLAGSVATLVLPLASLICTPPAGATLLSVTVPCEVAVPLTEFGSKLRDDKAGCGGGGVANGCTVSIADTIAPE